jgi:putative N6-adenine-specific DNA methylase
VPFKVEASCKKSRIYHQGAAAQRVKTAIKDAIGAKVDDEAPITVKARIDDDLCTLSVDTSGESLHKRGHKVEVAKAPMRENMAALFLRQCGYRGSEPVVDPMCGSGTFVIEAAEIAAGLQPGRSRSFAFEQLASFDPAAWQKLRGNALPQTGRGGLRFYGSDRDAGAIRMSRANAERAGVTALTEFREHAVSDLVPPEGPPGLVIVNPPYGGRIGETQSLYPLYRALGQTLLARFAGWRVGIITNEASLAAATGLPFAPPGPPVTHGGLRVVLYQAGPLPPV